MKLKTLLLFPLIGLLTLSAITLFSVIIKQDDNRAKDKIKNSCAQMMSILVNDDFISGPDIESQWDEDHHNMLAIVKDLKDALETESIDRIVNQLKTINNIKNSNSKTVNVQQLEFQIHRSALVKIIFDIHNEASNSTQSEYLKLNNITIILCSLLPTLLLSLIIYTNTHLFPQIQNLNMSAQRIATGHFKTPIKIKSNDEIGSLAKSMENMRISLLEHEKTIHSKNEEIEAFVYAVSHDLRGPLVNLVGFTNEINLTISDIEKNPGDDIKDFLDDINMSVKFISDNAHKLESLIEGLLKLSRTGRQVLEPEYIDTEFTIRQAANDYKNELESINGAIVVDKLHPVFIDPNAFDRVLTNIISNAIKYRDKNRAFTLSISSIADGDCIRLNFQDNGIGFPQESMSKIFRVFQRFHPNVAEGEGMGLLIIKRLIERSDGSIQISNNEDHGSLIQVTLPQPKETRKHSTTQTDLTTEA